jgi:hypothetical protein
LSSKSTDGFNYFFAVNDQNNTLSLLIDVSEFGPIVGNKIVVEAAGPGYWGEIYAVYSVPPVGQQIASNLNPYTTLRFAIPIGPQSVTTTNATVSCTAQAGSNSNMNMCSASTILVGTSETAAQETTSVALLKFPITYIKNNLLNID